MDFTNFDELVPNTNRKTTATKIRRTTTERQHKNTKGKMAIWKIIKILQNIMQAIEIENQNMEKVLELVTKSVKDAMTFN